MDLAAAGELRTRLHDALGHAVADLITATSATKHIDALLDLADLAIEAIQARILSRETEAALDEFRSRLAQLGSAIPPAEAADQVLVIRADLVHAHRCLLREQHDWACGAVDVHHVAIVL